MSLPSGTQVRPGPAPVHSPKRETAGVPFPRLLLFLSCMILTGAAFPVAPLVYSGPLAPGARFSLEQPIQYLALAPVARLLDELSLLTSEQHAVFLASLGVLALGWTLRRDRQCRHLARARRLVRGACQVGWCVAIPLLTYVAGALLPRPMVRLRAAWPEDVLVDFHSHTKRSHDGRWRFDLRANRRWHAAAGFDAAYITDHQAIADGRALADEGGNAARSPALASAELLPSPSNEGSTILLPGIETVVPGAHINLLGVGPHHAGLFRHKRDLDTLAFAATSEPAPLALLTLPFSLDWSPTQTPRIAAIELSDASPRGLDFAYRHRERIMALADSLGVAMVASSNLHGWGATAAAWTALRIPGWRRLDAEALDRRIRETLQDREWPVTVVERQSLTPGESLVARALVLPRLLVHTWRMLTPLERLSCLLWLWIPWLLRRRARVGTLTAA